jgi:murein DD-endopeptidase MepM/ murein hydrolase activator NlpD
MFKLQKGNLVFNGKYPMPAAGDIVSPYGMRIHPVSGEYKMHTGIDINTDWHCPVISVADGQVVKIGISDGYGYYIIIKHELDEETFFSLYAHLSTIYVLPDHEIEQGDIIGLEGGEPGKDIFPGVSTGHHLHFEIRTGIEPSTHVDPIAYFYTPEREEETGNAFILIK